MDASASDMAELRTALDHEDAILVEERLQAHAFAQQCLRNEEHDQRLDRAELVATEVVEVVTTITGGALSTYRSKSDFPMGGAINSVVGSIAKVGSVLYAAKPRQEITPSGRAVRVACRTGKCLLLAQIAITTRDLMAETP